MPDRKATPVTVPSAKARQAGSSRSREATTRQRGGAATGRGGQATMGRSRKDMAALTEAALKEAGRTVFARSGYLEAKITDIAAQAGRSVGSFYKHFAGKEELLQALLTDWFEQAGQELAVHEAGHDLSQRPALRARVAAYWYTYQAHVPEIRALGQAALVNPVFALQLAQIRHAELQTMRDHLGRLRAQGYELVGDPAVLASAFNALLEGFCAVWVAEGGEPIGRELGDEEAIETLTGLLHHGLVRGRAGGASG
jgi:AcrR family transcriptional regulator